ncbi:MAG: T9SS type A sorting domain-containing protein [Candidatus Marinimicrobia bacterium]|nr:T9SS type A sorting domain-containing protein [Candidatus Neomarinimicrobiota bacterium]
MKKLSLVTLVVLAMVVMLAAQESPISDYVEEFRGDTAVVLPEYLYEAITYDTANVPEGRVYLLKAGELYELGSNPTTKSDRHTVIVGEATEPLYNGDPQKMFPVICGKGGNSGGINPGGDLTLKNVCIVPASAEGTLGWTFFWFTQPNCRITLENCIAERTRWVIIASNAVAGTRVYIRDSYFVNLSGQECRRNGGVYDNVDNATDTIWVENSTHVVAQGMMYKFRNYPIKLLMFNHNTFINCAGIIFETNGFQSRWVVTNNIFVNSNVQPYTYIDEDFPEVDQDKLPLGIINVDTLPSDMDQVDRKVLVDRNLVYWDSRLLNLAQYMKDNNINNTDEWYDQTIKMNTRTKAMFDDDNNWPYLVEGTWYEKLPNFTDPRNLLTTYVDTLRDFAINTMDITKAVILPDWRLVFVGSDFYVYPDWPVPIDLSYSDDDIVDADGYPIGDLNWFPDQKSSWLQIRDNQYEELLAALDEGRLPQGVGVREENNVLKGFKVNQNYPNPFNPTTNITFTLPHSGKVTVKVFDMLGREVTTLMNGEGIAKTYNITFDGSNLASGVYFYTVEFAGQKITKKMVLMK